MALDLDALYRAIFSGPLAPRPRSVANSPERFLPPGRPNVGPGGGGDAALEYQRTRDDVAAHYAGKAAAPLPAPSVAPEIEATELPPPGSPGTRDYTQAVAAPFRVYAPPRDVPRRAQGARQPELSEDEKLVQEGGWANASREFADASSDWRMSPVQVLTRGIAGLNTGTYAAKQDLDARSARREQLDAMRAKAEAERQQQSVLEAEIGKLPPDQQAMARLNPEAFAKAQIERAFPDPTKAPPMRERFDGMNVVQEEFVPGEGWRPIGSGPRFNPKAGVNVSVGQPALNINMPSEKQANKVQEYYGAKFSELQENAAKADTDLARLEQLNTLLGQVETGALAPASQTVKRTLKSLGIEPESLGLADDVAPAEAAGALANQMALQLRDPSSGAGMPGALSDSDRKFLTQMIPGLTTSKEGRELMIDFNRKLIQRRRDVAKIARDFASKNGAIDQRFFDELDAHSAANPIAPPMVSTPDEAAKLKPGTLFMTPDGQIRRRN